MDIVAIYIGYIVSWISKAFGFGAGATWSGEIALWFDPHILPKLLLKIKKGIIIVAGTNGKTTTTLMIKNILEDQGFSVLHNESGANLLNGIVSSFFSSAKKTYDFAVFEVDENSLPGVISNFTHCHPEQSEGSRWDSSSGQAGLRMTENLTIVLLNLFRDQLDRYGEVDTIAEKWQRALKDVTKNTELIINADDPHLAFIGKQVNATVSYFGLDDKTQYLPKMQHATDTIFCPSCKERLTFSGVYFSHLGDWECTKCGFTHPKVTLTASHVTSPLEGVYNTYNTLAATLVLETVGVDKKQIEKSLKNFMPAFGRMEEILYGGKNIKILLSKNPTGFNESLRTVLSSKQKGPMLLLLNDRIPDGMDVSWIWDVDMEQLDDYHYPLIISGDRVYDMALRIKYAVSKFSIFNFQFSIKSQFLNEKNVNTKNIFIIEKNMKKAVEQFVSKIKERETGWILATYSAMLDVRKIITGRKIL